MGRVRTKTIKKSAKLMIEKYYSRLTLDFQTNKKVCDEIAILPSKRVRNKIAGFITVSNLLGSMTILNSHKRLMKRIQRGPVRGISLKLQEEERERRMDFVPEISAIELEQIQIDQDTNDMLEHLGVQIPNTQVVTVG